MTKKKAIRETIDGFNYTNSVIDDILTHCQLDNKDRDEQVMAIASRGILNGNEWAIGRYLDYLIWKKLVKGEPEETRREAKARERATEVRIYDDGRKYLVNGCVFSGAEIIRRMSMPLAELETLADEVEPEAPSNVVPLSSIDFDIKRMMGVS